MNSFTTRDLNTLMANSVLDTHPPESKIWRDLERDVLLVAETSGSSPYDKSSRYHYLGRVADAQDVLRMAREGMINVSSPTWAQAIA
jgi:hypothetical protein